MKRNTLLLLCIFTIALIALFACDSKKKIDNIAWQEVSENWDDFADYVIDIWNCTKGDGFEDIPVPNALLESYSTNALRQFYATCYDLVWIDYEKQINPDNWSWEYSTKKQAMEIQKHTQLSNL